MKKSFILALALASLIGTAGFADESYVTGGFEATGNVVAGAGWQRFKVKPVTAAVARDVNGTIPGPMGAYTTAAGVNKEDDFKFFVDQFELDLAKSFGENIRVRGDFDFGGRTLNGGPRFNNASGAGIGSNVIVEQAYATANLGLGNGVEFLLGRFNAPIGFEKVNIVKNDTISRSELYRALRPNTLTGAKFYYAFSDMVDWNVYIVNNALNYENGGNTFYANTDVPAFGTRLGFNWGDEGKKSTFGVSAVEGQDHANIKKHMSFLGDIDWQWWATDNFAFGGEALYRQIDTTTAGTKNGKYYGALANLHYNFSDVWDGTLKYAYTKDVNGLVSAGVGVLPVTGAAAQSLTGAKQQIHEITVAGNYSITDGAKLKLEGGYTYDKPTGTGNGQHIFGVAGALAYEF